MDLVKEGRRLLRSGEVQVKSKGALWSSQSRRMLFLMTDILLVAIPQGHQYVVDHVIDLQACKVSCECQGQGQDPVEKSAVGSVAAALANVVSEGLKQQGGSSSSSSISGTASSLQGNQQLFQITWPGGTLEMTASSVDDRDEWLSSIFEAVCDCVDEEGRVLGWRHQYMSGTMHSAVISRDDGKVRSLIGLCESGQADYEGIESQDEEGYTPLHYACILRLPGIIKMLLEAGVSAMVPDRHGYTPMHWAALQLDAPSMAVLCAYASDVDVPDREMRTPLFLACVEGRDVTGRTDTEALRACIASLVERKANVNARDPNGVSIAQYLAASWQHEPLRELLAADANIVAVDDTRKRSALHFAAAAMPLKLAVGEGTRVLNRTMDAMAGGGGGGGSAISSNGGSSSNSDSGDGSSQTTAVERLKLSDGVATLQTLLEGGARPNARDGDGRTPLQVLAESAERWGMALWDAVATLVSFGARFDESPQCSKLKATAPPPLGGALEEWLTAPTVNADGANIG
jgi:ankyrin repeat protein